MSTTYSTNLKLGESAIGDTGWGPIVTANWNTIDGLAPIGALAVTTTEIPSASLNVAVSAGTMVNSSGVIVNYSGTASQAITANTTKYLYLTDLGVLTVGSAWPANPTKFVPLAIVTAGSSTISSIVDSRMVFRSVSQ